VESVITALARPPLVRALRSRRGRIAVVAWCALALAFALNARSGGSPHAADHVLIGAYAPLVLPFLTYALTGAVMGPGSLSLSAAPLVAFGARPAHVAAVAVAVAIAACALSGGLVATVVDLVAHASADPPLGRDALACAYAGGLGGAVYASWFALSASFGRRGGGRPVFLVLDWVLGAGDGPTALVTPRAHVRNLFGGTAPLELSERTSALLLALIGLACAAVAIRRVVRRA
jgi:hypothetical protein